MGNKKERIKMEMMTVEQLKAKHKRERILKERAIARRKRKIKENFIGFIGLSIFIFASWLLCCIVFSL